MVEVLKNIPGRKGVNSILARAMLCSILLLSSGACTPKERSRWTGASYNLGNIPSDICMVNGVPQVINASTESLGDVNLVYIRKNGDLVVKHYTSPPLRPWQLDDAGEYFWSGGTCPSSR